MEHVKELISAYIDHELSDSERLLVENHLTTCKECQSLAKELSLMSQQITNYYQSVDVPDDFEQKVFADLNGLASDQISDNKTLKWIAIFASVLLLVVFLASFSPIVLMIVGLASSFFTIMYSLIRIIPLIITQIPYLTGGSMMLAFFVMLLSVWSLRHLLVR
ncbi:zf-HC2 domain-containing protein [Microaerobacter geothermalis]|uniref:anti-sigma factor family protein n=1 Tax=Microaerobacter geothermalis TaxID=674972 RepID=UPI001F2216AB|nr:zf-HC2 domain-containing protein [Microaerobacter geothermalis]MCF6093025.1 zf-HC2 domain-containing protein [Microaerobacter geothermalis]